MTTARVVGGGHSRCVWHIAEGKDVAQYLSPRPGPGRVGPLHVEQTTDRWADGEVVRCLPEDRISRLHRPRTIRRTDDPGGTYGASHAKAACGRYWPDTSPNVLVISIEVAGFAKEGPTEAQQRSMVALWDELKARYPKVVPLGHRDWQDVKPCPGKSTGMKAASSIGSASAGRASRPERGAASPWSRRARSGSAPVSTRGDGPAGSTAPGR